MSDKVILNVTMAQNDKNAITNIRDREAKKGISMKFLLQETTSLLCLACFLGGFYKGVYVNAKNLNTVACMKLRYTYQQQPLFSRGCYLQKASVCPVKVS